MRVTLGGEIQARLQRPTGVAVLLTALAVLLGALAALGLGAAAAYGYGLAWSTRTVPRWLGWLELVAGGLLVLTPLAVTIDILFLPFFFGAILTLVWLFAAGLLLSLRRPRAVSYSPS